MDNMQMKHIEELANTLLEAAKGDGCITFALLNHLIPEEIREPAIIEALFDFLHSHDIDIIQGNNYWPYDTKIH